MAESDPDDPEHADHDETPGDGLPHLAVRRAVAEAQAQDQEPQCRRVAEVARPRDFGGFGMWGLDGFALERLLSEALDRVQHVIEGSGKGRIADRSVSRGRAVGRLMLTLCGGVNQWQRLAPLHRCFLGLPRGPERVDE
jgi:hypothetical protein